jgi:transcriptional regulator with XRE-family HTH domain
MKTSQAQTALPLSVRRALKKLGTDIGIARKRRRLSMTVVAQRAFIGRNTLTRVERGDAGVSIGIYATVLFVLGLADRLNQLADPVTDDVGLSLENSRLPARTRTEQRNV